MKQQPATSMTNNQSHPHHLAASAGLQLGQQQQQHLQQHQRHLSQQQQHQPQSQQIQIQHQQQQLHSQQLTQQQQQMHQHQLNQSPQQHSLPQQQFQLHQNQQPQQQQLHQRQHLQEPQQHVQSPAAACHQQPMAANMQQSTQTQPRQTSATTSNSQLLKKELPANGKKTKGRVRIKMEFIHNKLRRYTTFSKRKTGIMKKAFELATLTGTQVMLLVASETGHVYTFATKKLQPMIISEAGKALIQTCLNSPDSDNLLMSAGPSGPASAGAASAVSQASPSASSSTSSGPSTPGSSGSPQHHIHQQQQPPVPMQQGQQLMAARQSTLASSSSPMQYQNARGQCVTPAQVQSRHNMMLAASTDQCQQQQQQQMIQHHVRTSSSCGQQQVSASSSSSSNHPSTDQRMSATGFEETDLSYSINDDLNDRSNLDTYSSALATLIGSDQEPQPVASPSKEVNQPDGQSANRYRKMIEPCPVVSGSMTRGQQFSNNPLYVSGQTVADQQQHQFHLNLSSSSTLGPQTSDESLLSGDMSSSYQYTSSVQLAPGESQVANGSQRAKQPTCACVHHQQDHQQQLYTPSSRSSSRQQTVGPKCVALDTTSRNFNAGTLAEECNGALFMEYQTSRSQLAGAVCLEELQSLNVNPCDSDTLEEHMNLLSGDDCFSNQYELQDFASDNFLNMLCLNNNNSSTTTSAGQQLTSCASTTIGNQPPSDLLLSSTPSLVNECSESPIDQQSPQLLIRSSHLVNGSSSSGASSTASSCITSTSSSSNSNSSTSSRPGSKRTAARKNRSSASSKQVAQQQQPTTTTPQCQDKIATTNTNRSLLPKRASAGIVGSVSGQGAQCCNPLAKSTTVLRLACEMGHQHDKACNSRANNARITALVPDDAGSPCSAGPLQLQAASSAVCNSQSTGEWPDTGYRQQLENLRKKLKMDVEPTGVPLDSGAARPLKEANSQQTISVGCQQPRAVCKPGNGSTTYLIARPLVEGLESTGGTIYLRTANGLVPISSAVNSRSCDANG